MLKMPQELIAGGVDVLKCWWIYPKIQRSRATLMLYLEKLRKIKNETKADDRAT